MTARETWFNVDASPHWCNATRTPASSALLHDRGPPNGSSSQSGRDGGLGAGRPLRLSSGSPSLSQSQSQSQSLDSY